MQTKVLSLITIATLSTAFLTSCDSPTGAGAGYGAAAGAIIGAAATGNVRGAAIGAAAGAATGALVGHAIQEDRARQYGPVPEGGYPVARWSGTPGLVISPFPPNRLVDVTGIPRGALVRDPASGGIFRKP
jgi:hypothetical protein